MLLEDMFINTMTIIAVAVLCYGSMLMFGFSPIHEMDVVNTVQEVQPHSYNRFF